VDSAVGQAMLEDVLHGTTGHGVIPVHWRITCVIIVVIIIIIIINTCTLTRTATRDRPCARIRSSYSTPCRAKPPTTRRKSTCFDCRRLTWPSTSFRPGMSQVYWSLFTC